MTKKYIHINQHKIRSNLKNNLNEPVITVKTSKQNIYGHEVTILGESKVLYGGNNKPILSCGARVVIETHSDVLVDGKKFEPFKILNRLISR